MPQYMLSVWHDELYDPFDPGSDDSEMVRIGAKVTAWNQAAVDAGIFVFANGMYPPSSATVVRANADGEISMTDGPYVETKEMMGGFWIIDVPDMDTALEWAKKGTLACELPVEVRPFHG